MHFSYLSIAIIMLALPTFSSCIKKKSPEPPIDRQQSIREEEPQSVKDPIQTTPPPYNQNEISSDYQAIDSTSQVDVPAGSITKIKTPTPTPTLTLTPVIVPTPINFTLSDQYKVSCPLSLTHIKNDQIEEEINQFYCDQGLPRLRNITPLPDTCSRKVIFRAAKNFYHSKQTSGTYKKFIKYYDSLFSWNRDSIIYQLILRNEDKFSIPEIYNRNGEFPGDGQVAAKQFLFQVKPKRIDLNLIRVLHYLIMSKSSISNLNRYHLELEGKYRPRNSEGIKDEEIGIIRSESDVYNYSSTLLNSSKLYRFDQNQNAIFKFFSGQRRYSKLMELNPFLLVTNRVEYPAYFETPERQAWLKNLRPYLEGSEYTNITDKSNSLSAKKRTGRLIKSLLKGHLERLYKNLELFKNDPHQMLGAIARFYWEFVSTHPFANGTGRVAKVLIEYIMAQQGRFSPIWSFWGEDLELDESSFLLHFYDSVYLSEVFHYKACKNPLGVEFEGIDGFNWSPILRVEAFDLENLKKDVSYNEFRKWLKSSSVSQLVQEFQSYYESTGRYNKEIAQKIVKQFVHSQLKQKAPKKSIPELNLITRDKLPSLPVIQQTTAPNTITADTNKPEDDDRKLSPEEKKLLQELYELGRPIEKDILLFSWTKNVQGTSSILKTWRDGNLGKHYDNLSDSVKRDKDNLEFYVKGGAIYSAPNASTPLRLRGIQSNKTPALMVIIIKGGILISEDDTAVQDFLYEHSRAKSPDLKPNLFYTVPNVLHHYHPYFNRRTGPELDIDWYAIKLRNSKDLEIFRIETFLQNEKNHPLRNEVIAQLKTIAKRDDLEYFQEYAKSLLRKFISD